MSFISTKTFTNLFKDNQDIDFSHIVNASAPGRVNIIGEHTDYSGYCVLPCALSQRIYVICAKGEKGGLMSVKNVDSSFQNHVFSISDRYDQLKIPCSITWSDYLLCGYFAALSIAKDSDMNLSLIDYNLYMLVEGLVPYGSGLSSSSALVVATALSLVKLWGLPVDKGKVAEKCIEAERIIGTLGGGMDQTISCLGVKGKALYILPGEPIEEITLPDDLCLVIADSLVRAEKGSGVKLAFNTRVVECRVAAIYLAALIGCKDLTQIKKLKDCQRLFENNIFQNLNAYDSEKSLDDFIKYANDILCNNFYTIKDIEDTISQTTGQNFTLYNYFRDSSSAIEVLENVGSFKLKQRCLHVLEETKRVISFRKECNSISKDSFKLGALLNESHRSLRDLYECSCKELDEIQQFAIDNGIKCLLLL
jgi:N-acetylgalactosamine kinase